MIRRASGADLKTIGAVFGAVAGFALSKRALGAIAGAIGGYMLTARFIGKAAPTDAPRPPSPSLRYLERHVALAASLARAGGDFDSAARHATRSWFEFDLRCDREAMKRVDSAIDRAAREPTTSTESAARSLVDAFAPSRAERERVLFSLFRVAMLAPLSSAREAALAGATRGLGLSEDDLETQRAAFVPSMHGRATDAEYRVLGARPGMSFERLKECYREAARTWHPDRFTHLGAEKAAEAERRFKAIQAAWAILEADAERSAPPRTSRCPNCRKFTGLDEVECIRCGHEKISTVRGGRVIRCAYCRYETPLGSARMSSVVDCKNCRAIVIQ